MRDPIWQFVGAVLGAIALVVAIGLAAVQRGRRSLSYELRAHTPVVGSPEFQKRSQILYDGTPAIDLTVLTLIVRCGGNRSIPAADFERPVSFVTGGRLLSAAVVGAKDNLAPIVAVEKDRIVIQPALMNAGEWIELEAVVDEWPGRVTADVRAVGVRGIRRGAAANSAFAYVLAGASALFVGFATGVQALISARSDAELGSIPIALGVALAGYLVVVVAALGSRRIRRAIFAMLASSDPRSSSNRSSKRMSHQEIERPSVADSRPPTSASEASEPTKSRFLAVPGDLATLTLTNAELDAFLGRADTLAATQMAPDASLAFRFLDLLPRPDLTFGGFSAMAGRRFQLDVNEDGSRLYSIRRKQGTPVELIGEPKAPWQVDATWRELVEASWLRVRPFDGWVTLYYSRGWEIHYNPSDDDPDRERRFGMQNGKLVEVDLP